jgi:PadR family transcriptional regulator PadR
MADSRQSMTNTSSELLHGTLDTLILKTLTAGRRHGYAIAGAIEDATDGVVEIEEGSLYPALYRMERKGWIEAEWGVSELGRRAKFYRLTPKGRRQLVAQSAEWARFAAAISRVLVNP